MTEHAVVIAGGGPTGLMLAGELALAEVDVAVVERRASQDLPGSRAGGLHSRTIEVLDQRGIADRFLSEGQVAQVAGFASVRLDISDFPTRHPYGLGLWQNHIERILAGWVGELRVPIHYGIEVTGFAQDDTGVDVQLSDGQPPLNRCETEKPRCAALLLALEQAPKSLSARVCLGLKEVAPRPNCSTPSFVASLPSRWTLRTPVARRAGRPGSSPRWVWSGCRPDRALRPGRCPRTAACPGR
jgi:hypothetical protein